ncbi:hypothetical protein R1sor_014526 [Riccia sorocarpa]|uniref:Uncharacterized protein n=1 Tax=Riccia sorocarpa TaxID=122646 RepID=A0ABD3H9M8_9MARC
MAQHEAIWEEIKLDPERKIPKILKDVVVSRVKPSSDYDHPKVVYPNFFDIFVVIDRYQPTFLLSKLDSEDPSTQFENFVLKAKTTLSHVLGVHAPLAGKWVSAEDPWMRKLICEGDGAIFVEATVDDDMANYLDGEKFVHPEAFTGEYTVRDTWDVSQQVDLKHPNGKELPSLIIQVTKFRCGGVSFVININHMTLDGSGFVHFMLFWVEIAFTGQTSIARPTYDRSLLVSLEKVAQEMGLPPRSLVECISARSPVSAGTVTVRKNFAVKRKTLDWLRQKSHEISGDPSEQPVRFSKFSCISAALWRCCSRLPGVNGGGPPLVEFLIEGRERWNDPPLPEGYTGNVLMCVPLPTIPASELCEKPYSFAASKVHQTIVSVNPKTAMEHIYNQVKEAVEMKAKVGNPDSQDLKQGDERVPAIFLSSLLHFDFPPEIDLGAGKVFCLSPCPVWPDTPGGFLFILPPFAEEDGLTLHVQLDKTTLDLFLADPEFQMLISKS